MKSRDSKGIVLLKLIQKKIANLPAGEFGQLLILADKRQSTLYNEVNPFEQTAKLGVITFLDICDFFEDQELETALAQLQGGSFVPHGQGEAKQLHRSLSDQVREMGEVAARIGEAISPESPGAEKITSSEFTDINQEIDQAVKALEDLRESAKQGGVN